MHVDMMLEQFVRIISSGLGFNVEIAVVLIVVLYFVVKWAAKNGVKEAVREVLHEMDTKKEGLN